MSRLLIVDGHAYAYRAFHAIRQLSSPAGEPTNALFGFIKMLGKLGHAWPPSHQAVVWDGGLAAERLEALPEYKSQRPPMPATLAAQIPRIHDYLGAARIASLRAEGVEADDWIAGLARRAEAEGCEVAIASADKDFMQLVGPRIGLLNPNDPVARIWTADDVRAKTGVAPDQVVDWLSLVGDAVDNIPGVPGVGAKTAAALLNQFGSLQALIDRLAEVRPEGLRRSLEAARDDLRRNRDLIRLREHCDRPESLDALAVRPPDTAELRRLYAGWGFRTLLAELDETPLLL